MVTSKPSVGLIGLGLVGIALAQRLRAAGFEVTGFDVREEARTAFSQMGFRVVDSCQQIAAAASRICLAVFDTRDVLKVLEGDSAQVDGADRAASQGLLNQPGHQNKVRVVIDFSTGSPELLEALATRLATQGIDFIEAPLSGSSQQIAAGEATALLGGGTEAIARYSDILQAISPKRFHVGAAGMGAKAKLATNLVLGLNRAVLAEGMVFAQSLGIAPARFLELVQNSPANSGAAQAKGDMMVALLNGEAVPAQSRIRQHLKDVELMLAAAGADSQALPLSKVHAALMREAVQHGEGDLDNAAIIHRIAAARTKPDPG